MSDPANWPKFPGEGLDYRATTQENAEGFMPKPTIEELEAILQEPDRKVHIAPNGEVYVRPSYDGLRGEIQDAINRNSAENGSNTPDWILAQYLIGCLKAWDDAMMERERWYGRPIEGVPVSETRGDDDGTSWGPR